MERAKWLFRKMERPVRPEDETITCFRDGEVTLRKNRRTEGFTESLKEIGYQGIRKGDLVIHEMDAFAGAVGVSDSEGKSSPVYTVCQPKQNISAEYFAHVVREMARSEYVAALATGIRERSTDFRWSTFSIQHLPVPSFPEQRHIARFLDTYAARTDRLIRAKERLIELLEEQKQTVIQKAITGGLSPNSDFQDSTIDWVDRLPSHWRELPLKRVASIDNSGSYGKEPGEGDVVYPVATTAQIDNDGRFAVDKMPMRGFSKEKAKRYLCESGHILVVKSSGSIFNVVSGKAGLVEADTPPFVFSNFLLRVLPERKTVRPEYLYFVLKSPLTKHRVYRMVYGSTYPNLRVDQYRSSVVPIPPLDEQTEIIDTTKGELSNLNSAIEKTRSEIALVREYRTRLIADVVTGKLDVREAEAAQKENGMPIDTKAQQTVPTA
jgi:type I restriction enzyme S subunit